MRESVSPAQRLHDLRASADACVLLPFYGHRPARPGAGPWMLSNFWPADFLVDGVRYRHNEQFMMAGKARLFGDTAALERILAEPNPLRVKQLGRAVRGFEPAVWDEACYGIVLTGLLAKFGQNRSLATYLASTAPAVLVEASPTDRVWGVGLSVTDPDVREPRRWRGRNMLGFALTECRDQLRSIAE